MSDNAKHEAVAVVMIFDAAGIALPDVAEVTSPQGNTLEAKVNHQHLPEAECITWMSTNNVVPYPLLRNLIITLAKLRTEHHAQHRHVCLVTGSHGKFAKPELISRTSRKREVDAEMGLCWIVAIPVVIKEPKVGTNQSTTLQIEVL